MILTRSTRISQPQGQVELDRTNPLLRGSGAGVEFCFLPGSNFDPASRNTWAKNSGSDVIRRFGRAVSFAGDGGNAYTQITNVTNQEKLTLIAVIERDGANPYACVLATSSINSAFRLEFAGNGSDLALIKGGVAELPSINIPAGVPHVVVTSHNQLTGEYYIVASPLYGGNKLRAAGTNTQSSIPSNGTLTINRNGGANTFNGSVGLLCGFFDFLSESVAHKILDNPWQLFRPAQRHVYFDMGAGGGTTPVSSDQAATYSIRGAVSSDQAASYAIRSSVSADLSASYNIQTAIAVISDLPSGYEIRTSAQSDASAEYAIRASVQADSSADYEVRSSVQSDVGAAFVVRGAVLSDASASYVVRTSASADLIAAYEIQTASGVSASFAASYNVRAAVQADVSAAYDLRTAVGAISEHAFMVRGLVSSDLDASYTVEAAITQVYADLQAAYLVDGGAVVIPSQFIASVPAGVFSASVPSEKFSAAVPGGSQ